jgi:hypothetical protein
MKARLLYARLLSLARKDQRGAVRAPAWWLSMCASAGIFLLALVNSGRIIRAVRMRRLRAHPERSLEQASTMWYERMAKFLSRRGIEKSRSHTAQEFARTIEDARLQSPVRRFTDAYESARFGNSLEDARKLPELLEEVESAAKK